MFCEYCKNEINNFDTKKMFYLYEKVIADLQGQGILHHNFYMKLKNKLKQRYGRIFEHKIRLKKANEKIKKCATNDSFVAHLCHKVRNLCHKSEAIYYINVPQSEGREKKYHIEALVREKAGFRDHSSCFKQRERNNG